MSRSYGVTFFRGPQAGHLEFTKTNVDSITVLQLGQMIHRKQLGREAAVLCRAATPRGTHRTPSHPIEAPFSPLQIGNVPSETRPH